MLHSNIEWLICALEKTAPPGKLEFIDIGWSIFKQ